MVKNIIYIEIWHFLAHTVEIYRSIAVYSKLLESYDLLILRKISFAVYNQGQVQICFYWVFQGLIRFNVYNHCYKIEIFQRVKHLIFKELSFSGKKPSKDITMDNSFEILDLSSLGRNKTWVQKAFGDISKRSAAQQITIGGVSGWWVNK